MAEPLTPLSNSDGKFVESLYEQYKQDPESVDPGWRQFFDGFEFARTNYGDTTSISEDILKENHVVNLINAYRTRGHLFTSTNPVRERRKYTPDLSLKNFDLSDADLDTVFQAGHEIGIGAAKLRDIVAHLEQTYCGSIGVEFKYAREPRLVEALQKRMEEEKNTPNFSEEKKRHILHKLNQAVAFEGFLGSKFVGQKRFSLEGTETVIPALDAIVEKGADLGIEEFVIGMAHRGRLNVLANIMNKTYADIFSEFEENVREENDFEGDVKYHMGFSTDVKTDNGKDVHLSLCPNPSHLETIGPIAQGMTRAKMDLKYDGDHKRIATIVMHGDAAIAGQGIVMEQVQMSELEPYETGGTIHVVLNNQVGFTTNYLDSRSATYCTDIAKMTQSPVFHVNADDVEAVVYATELAMEFRQAFHKDVFIDLLGYRRHGHNEGDEPRFTQPTLYKIIEKHPNPRQIYFEKLKSEGKVGETLAKEMEKEFKRMLQDRLNEVKEKKEAVDYHINSSIWKKLHPAEDNEWETVPVTGYPEKKLRPLAEHLVTLPEDKEFYVKYKKIQDNRRKMLEETDALDWSMGESMAYASLLDEGFNIRISGQDVERGTFAHRHAVIKINDSEEEYTPLAEISENQGRFEIYNSLLSEYAVLGFEYGYSWSAPDTLAIWEAQFGDFANGAQIVIDQFISSAMTKWKRISGLTLLLPHGYEGQGPEHSSARLERWLSLCSGFNMQVCYPTTPANFFHMIRRQMIRDFRVPLIVMSPKSLLRHPKVVSPFGDFTKGMFQEVIDDPYVKDAKKVQKVLFCTGKVYYDLSTQQEEDNRDDVAIVRLEQINPLPIARLKEVIAKYPNAKAHVWVQEEPENQGSWPFIMRKFREVELQVISRKESATTATGYKKQHNTQQAYIVNRSFDIIPKKKAAARKKSTSTKTSTKSNSGSKGKSTSKRRTASKK